MTDNKEQEAGATAETEEYQDSLNETPLPQDQTPARDLRHRVFDFFAGNHNLTLTESEIDDIIAITEEVDDTESVASRMTRKPLPQILQRNERNMSARDNPKEVSAETEEWSAKSDTCASWIQAGEKELIFHEAICREHNAALRALQEKLRMRDFLIKTWEENYSQLRAEKCALQRKNEAEYGRGVTAGKLEALNYSSDERERYGKWVTEGEMNRALRQRLDKAEAELKELKSPSISRPV